jgi:hypothetical protein
VSGYCLVGVVCSAGGLLGDGREDKGLIALLCGRSDLDVRSGEYIAVAPLQREVEHEKKLRDVNSLQWMSILSSNLRCRRCNRVYVRGI